MSQSYPTLIPGLRSPSAQVNGLVYFGRMLDKIRLTAAGTLPQDWQAASGLTMKNSLESRCCSFIRIDYSALKAETLKGGTDEELLAWAFANGRKPSDEEIEIWNAFMLKRGWRDSGTATLIKRKAENGFQSRDEIQTVFDYIDADEGRALREW